MLEIPPRQLVASGVAVAVVVLLAAWLLVRDGGGGAPAPAAAIEVQDDGGGGSGGGIFTRSFVTSLTITGSTLFAKPPDGPWHPRPP